MNFKKLALISLAAIVSLGFVGCKHKVKAVPYDTYPEGGISSGGGGESGIFDQQIENSDLGDDFDDLLGRTDANGGIRGQFQNIFFDFESSAISAAERPKISAAADRLRTNPSARLIMEGHCDWRGTAEYNLNLGNLRAASVKRYLETLGVSGSRLEVTSKGDQEAFEGGSAADMAKDRRVEIILVP